MNALQSKRMLKLAAFIEEVHPKHYSIHTTAHSDANRNAHKTLQEIAKNPSVKNEVSLTACSVGWLPAAFPERFKWTKADRSGDVGVVGAKGSKPRTALRSAASDIGPVCEYLGITDSEFYNTFTAEGYTSDNPSPKTAAKKIRNLVQKKQKQALVSA